MDLKKDKIKLRHNKNKTTEISKHFNFLIFRCIFDENI